MKIVSISGTGRPDNYTSRALDVVNDELERREVPPTLLDARDLSLAFPGEPPTEDARRLRTAVEEASAVIIATPEYHGSFAAMTKLIVENLGFPSARRRVTPPAFLPSARGWLCPATPPPGPPGSIGSPPRRPPARTAEP